MTWKDEWKQQLRNLNRLALWMLVDEAVTDEMAARSLVQLKAWLDRVERLILAVERDEKE